MGKGNKISKAGHDIKFDMPLDKGWYFTFKYF